MWRIGMSEKELRRVEVLVRVKSKELKVVDAASLMGVGYRKRSGCGKHANLR